MFSLVWVAGCTVKENQQNSIDNEPVVSRQKPYFISVAIDKFSSIQSPCVDVEIEGNKFSMELDLGLDGYLTISHAESDEIRNKNFIREKQMYGFRGTQYLNKLYRLPQIQIGKMTFVEPLLQEENADFLKNSVSVENGGDPSPGESGRLGWKLFRNVNLLIDVKNSNIAFCDSIETLKNQGYLVETFIKTPLILERGLVELYVSTPEGPLLCMLDTGATWNFLNTELRQGTTIDQAMWDPQNILECPSIKIEGEDFGCTSFHRIPIDLPIYVEAVLGMEFFQQRLVFLDFKNGYAYFSKNN